LGSILESFFYGLGNYSFTTCGQLFTGSDTSSSSALVLAATYVLKIGQILQYIDGQKKRLPLFHEIFLICGNDYDNLLTELRYSA